MIAYLQGVVTEKETNKAIVDIAGLGYEVFVIPEDLNKLAINEPVKIYIREHIREQSHDLYGFLEIRTRQLFDQLTDVNGVGPRMALNLLSIGPSDNIRQAIAEGNVKYLQSANGVGKRVAERVVVDLKDKVGLVATGDAEAILHSGDVSDEALQALVGLGYSTVDAAKALQGIDTKLPTEDRVKQALRSKQ